MMVHSSDMLRKMQRAQSMERGGLSELYTDSISSLFGGVRCSSFRWDSQARSGLADGTGAASKIIPPNHFEELLEFLVVGAALPEIYELTDDLKIVLCIMALAVDAVGRGQKVAVGTIEDKGNSR